MIGTFPIFRLLGWLLPLCFGLAAMVRAEPVTVFAAASLGTALEEVGAMYEAETGHDLTLSFAGSSALARQVAAGAPADVVFLANPGWMDWLEERGQIAPGSRSDLLGNRMVLISATPGETVEIGPDALPGEGRVAMALVDAVPAGIYGKAALDHYGLWTRLEPRVVQADNVRAALKLVALGAAPWGIVYATDAQAEPGVHLRATFPEESHPPIRYPAALIRDAPSPAAQAFLDMLSSAAAMEIFSANGFSPLTGAAQ